MKHPKWLLPTRKAYRSLADDIRYLRYKLRNTSNTCIFCANAMTDDKVIGHHDNWLVMNNDFPYRKWDWKKVRDHLMLAPTRHLLTLADVTEHEWQEFGQIVAEYDENGYSIYLRSQHNSLKSVPHLHWHLIKID